MSKVVLSQRPQGADRFDIDGCFQDGMFCPFFRDERDFCDHPRAPKDDAYITDDDVPHPDWCPIAGRLTMIAGPRRGT